MALGIAGLFALKKLLIWDYGLNPDLGQEFFSILKILEGKIIYRDFVWIYGPFVLYLYSFLYKIFGWLGVHVIKITVAVVGTAGCYFAFKLARIFLSPLWSGVAALLAFSGLVAPAHVSGHIFSILCFIISLYLVLIYVKQNNNHVLPWAGLACGFSLLNKPIHYGGAAIAGAIFIILVNDFLFNKRRFRNTTIFLLFTSIIPLLTYGFLLFLVPANKLTYNLLPMYSGYFNRPETFFYMKDIVPFGLLEAQSFSELAGILNNYLGDSVRWWMIWGMAFLGMVRLLRLWIRDRKPTKEQVLLLGLVVHSLLLEFQVLVVPHLFATYVNMLPTYILLCYFVSVVCKRGPLKTIGIIFIGLWFTLFFIYSPLKYYLYYKGQGVRSSQKYIERITLTPYQEHVYSSATRLIAENTRRGDTILIADFNPLLYVFSGRESLFPEDDINFLKTSFFRYNNAGLHDLGYNPDFHWSAEQTIIQTVQENSPALIVIPEAYLAQQRVKKSPFLKYLLREWEEFAKVDNSVNPGPFDSGLNLIMFKKKQATPIN